MAEQKKRCSSNTSKPTRCSQSFILDAEKNLYGYELLFRDGVANCFPNINADEATSKLITEHHLLMGVEKITGSRKAFINFSADTLIHHFPTSIDPKSMVIEILETVPISSELMTACRELHRMGYQLALNSVANRGSVFRVMLPDFTQREPLATHSPKDPNSGF